MVASKPNVVATAAIRNHKVNGGGGHHHPQRPTDIDHNPDVIPGGNTGLMHHVSIHGPGKCFHSFDVRGVVKTGSTGSENLCIGTRGF